jgi:hypothetical protein
MILFQNVSLSEIESKKKEYQWKRPSACLACGRYDSIHGHGYTPRFFAYSSNVFFMKKWRCTACRCIMTTRPSIYWRRFQTSINDIFKILIERLINKTWPPWTTRQRGGNWLRNIKSYIDIHQLLKENSLIKTVKYFFDKQLPFF